MSGRKRPAEVNKLRIIAVYRILCRGEKMTAREIISELERVYGITADRKTIYSDIYVINRVVPIDTTTGHDGGHKKWDVIGECENG